MKVYITKGIPGSGKTTWALQKQRQHTIGDIVRANRDDIRELLCGKEYHNGSPIGSIENMVTVIQQNIISTAIVNNKDVIIDDCNLNPKFLKILTDFITRQSSNVGIEIVDFTNVPYELCLQRNNNRDRKVPEYVMQRMYDMI